MAANVPGPEDEHATLVGHDVLRIDWQDGPLVDPVTGERREPNGCFVETVIRAAVGRLEHYQAGRFACEENAHALVDLRSALEFLDKRTAAREAQGVEGTHEVHES